MKMQVIGVKVLRGVKDGNPWDMSSVLIQTPIENFSNAKVTVAGFGYEITEMPLDSSCLDKFKTVQFPCELDLDVTQRSRMGKFESVVIGYHQNFAAKVA
jgi:hypothetical protein